MSKACENLKIELRLYVIISNDLFLWDNFGTIVIFILWMYLQLLVYNI